MDSLVIAQAVSGGTSVELLLVQQTHVPRGGHAEIDQVVICNRSSTPATFRLSITLDGGATSDKDFLYYDAPLKGNETFVAIIAATLSDKAVMRGSASKGLLTFSVIGRNT